MLRQPSSLHPEVFVEVWRKRSIACANYEVAGKTLTQAIEDRLWDTSLKIVDYNVRLDWNSFCREHGLGVYK